MMLLFTKQDCPRCPKAKELVQGLQVDIIDSETDEGYFKAIELNIMSVPVLVKDGVKYSFDEIKQLLG